MKEKVVTFGEGNRLVGVITEAQECEETKDAPGVLILHAGITHHVGPFRLHVVTARRLAARGYNVLRFDVGGMGDSLAHKESGYDADRVLADVRYAMDELTDRKGTKRFVLMGLCTGASNAHKVAVIDDRVKGCIFLGGYGYPTWQFYLKLYWTLALDPKRVFAIVRRRGRKLFSRSGNKETLISEQFHWWVLPPKDKTRKDFVTLVDRGVNLLFVFSAGERNYFNYEKQMEHSFSSVNFKGRLKVVLNKYAHHTYSMAIDRDRLMSEVIGWLNDCYAEDPSTRTQSHDD